ncbi:hypothetical protein PAXRUDRAFT_33679 [Paxillus rubicundulus Ve08.2h10]|uniref:H/ACA ribonucleoprotein complex non-core subunit NAF1 n=1 Tax=Paxillus rubicundulus Ve08.2h10 TaxID=930991 RepID=A0A0D0E1G5_9AGAM|nr:hypothetical protein PAXRUDRAFT_33679 [Paxillus rubicundulus Ve08.2h10]
MDIEFKVPSAIPQDLLLIQDLIGTPALLTDTLKDLPDPPNSGDDSIDSTDNEVDSEDEVEADLLPRREENEKLSPIATPGESDSDTGSSSDSEDERVHEKAPSTSHPRRPVHDLDDEESGVTAATAYLQTKNEVVEADVIIPTISEVESDSTLDKVGEVMSIVGNVVIVKGLPADNVKSLSERALDVESLLVFEDRKVLGYIYETFGPTSQPLYQVKFNHQYPLDAEKVRISREVFHVPQRSHFVFVNQLKKLRGSDASNIHDEEPAEDEIEFSDDEQEAAFKAQRRKRRGQSVSSSRQTTPAPSRAHVDDMVDDTFHGSNPYDAYGPYDDDYHVAGPSRPLPIPYDDPYAEPAGLDIHVPDAESDIGIDKERRRGRVYDREFSRASRDRGSGRGTRGRGDRQRQPWSISRRVASQGTHPSTHPPFPATSGEAERATGHGQFPDIRSAYSPARPASNSWAFQQPNNMPVQNYQQPCVQPHINPRFASAFGFNLPGTSAPWVSPRTTPYYMPQPEQNWIDPWTVHDIAGTDGDEDTRAHM